MKSKPKNVESPRQETLLRSKIVILFLIFKLTYSVGQNNLIITEKRTDKFILLYIPNEQKEIYVLDLVNKTKTELDDLMPVLLPLKEKSMVTSIVAFENNTFLAKKRSTNEIGIADYFGKFMSFPKNSFLNGGSLEMKNENTESSDYLAVILRDTINVGKRKFGFIHKKSGAYLEPIFDDIDLQHTIDDKLIVSNYDRYGIISVKGEILIPIEFDKIVATRSNTFILVKSFDFTFLNSNLKSINFLENLTEIDGDNDLFVFKQNNLFGVFNEMGQLVLPPKYLKIERTQINGKYYFITHEKGVATCSLYDHEVRSFKLTGCSFINVISTSPVIFFAEKNDIRYIFDNMGSKISKFNANKITTLPNSSANFFVFRNDELWGLADIRGNIIQAPKWEQIQANCDGASYIGIYNDGTKSDFILKSGKIQQHDPCNSDMISVEPIIESK